MKFLVTHPGCITGDIVEFLLIAQATFFQHLKILREAGWITGETEGPDSSDEMNIKNFKAQVIEIF